MRHTITAFLIVATTAFSATPAAACYSWQVMTCGQPQTQVVLDEQRNVRGYLSPQRDGSFRILDKHRRIRGYVEGGIILGKDRGIRGYVEPSASLAVEGLPQRYSPVPTK